MKIYGLIGYPLEHSFSKKFFTEKFENENICDCSYRNFSLKDISDFPSLMRNTTGLSGLNVTIPYKEKILSFLNELDPVAEATGAVNTIKITGQDNDKYLKGFNTDVYGFRESLMPILDPSHHKSALILGTGGASKAVSYVLQSLGIGALFVSRSKKRGVVINYEMLTPEIVASHKLIINTTPLGTFPDTDGFPDIPYEAVSSGHILFDLVYNPPVTVFLSRGKENGAITVNGLEMLKLQAEKAWEIWTS